MTAPSLPRQSGAGQGVGIVHLGAVALVLAVGFGTGAAALSGSSTSAAAPPGGSTRALGRSMAASRGWTGAQWTCLNLLWTHESGWRVDARNPASPAQGIPQADPGSKMASAGADWATSATTQIRWGLGYIAGQYGNPCSAWSFEMSHTPNWY
jgi:resuscitation-promoting factor RpfB